MNKPTSPVPATLPKSPTGITGLDEITGGGLPTGRHSSAVAQGAGNTMKKKEIEKDSLVGKVTTVPSGAIEILRKQQEGYGYFKP